MLRRAFDTAIEGNRLRLRHTRTDDLASLKSRVAQNLSTRRRRVPSKPEGSARLIRGGLHISYESVLAHLWSPSEHRDSGRLFLGQRFQDIQLWLPSRATIAGH